MFLSWKLIPGLIHFSLAYSRNYTYYNATSVFIVIVQYQMSDKISILCSNKMSNLDFMTDLFLLIATVSIKIHMIHIFVTGILYLDDVTLLSTISKQ